MGLRGKQNGEEWLFGFSLKERWRCQCMRRAWAGALGAVIDSGHESRGGIGFGFTS